MIEPDYITELDIAHEDAGPWVLCETCLHDDFAVNMVRQFDAAWLCGRCDAELREAYEDQMKAARYSN